MGIKLFVDDMRSAPEGWHLSKTITEAIACLANLDVECVSLDHDIIFEPAGSAIFSNENFTAVAYYVAAMPKDIRPKRAYIHTANPAGAIRIKSIFDSAGIPSERVFPDMNYKKQLIRFENEAQ
jgi:hypothetical protein